MNGKNANPITNENCGTRKIKEKKNLSCNDDDAK